MHMAPYVPHVHQFASSSWQIVDCPAGHVLASSLRFLRSCSRDVGVQVHSPTKQATSAMMVRHHVRLSDSLELARDNTAFTNQRARLPRSRGSRAMLQASPNGELTSTITAHMSVSGESPQGIEFVG